MDLTTNAQAFMLEWPWRAGEHPDAATVDELITAGIVRRAPGEQAYEYDITNKGVRQFADADLLYAFRHTGREPANSQFGALLAGIEMRGLDI